MSLNINKRIIIGLLSVSLLTGVLVLSILSTREIKPEEITDEEKARETGIDLKIENASPEEILKKGILSDEGEAIKKSIVAGLQGQAGTLFENSDLRIYYLPPWGNIQDEFSVEIRTSDVTGAKNTTWKWFISKGFSEQDVCNLHIVFGLTIEARDSLQENGQTFSPIFDNCNTGT